MTRMLPVLLVLTLSACNRGMANTDQLRAAKTLFGQFETVFYAPADLVSGSGGYDHLSQQDANALRVPFADLRGGLDALSKSASTEILANADAVFVGAKDFGPPSGLGAVQSRFAYVVVFGKRAGPDVRKFFSGAPASVPSGSPVWQWTVPSQEGHPKPYTFYMTAVRSYVLVSGDLEQLQTLIQALSSSDKSTPTFDDVRDWKLVSQHSYWGYRRYRHAEVGNRNAAGLTDVTPAAQALIFFPNLKQSVATLRLLASDDDTAARINARAVKAKLPLPELKPSGAGSWEATIPLLGDQKSLETMFDVMGRFGFGVYL